MRPLPAALVALAALPLLASCDALGIDSPEKLAAIKEADGKAIGSACRHALRAIEDCYVLNPKASKAAVFAGWREMDEYMRENKIEGVPPTLARNAPPAKPSAAAGDADKADPDKPAGKQRKAQDA